MKAFKLLAIGFMLIMATLAQGQVSVNIHVGSPPAWGPSGYSDVRYYYLPDVQAYYDVQTSRFIYISGNQWVHRTYLPSRYRNYDLYHGYKVVMNDYRGNTPYSHYKEHKIKYARGYHGEYQKTNGEKHDKNYRNGDKRNRDYYERNGESRNNRHDFERNEGNRNNSNDQNRGRENNKQKDEKGGHDNGKGNRK